MIRKKGTMFAIVCILAVIFTGSISAFATNYLNYEVNKKPGGDQFDFPGNYTPPELTIDGFSTEDEWAETPILTEINSSYAEATVKAYRGESALFFYFDVADTVLLTYGDSNDDDVTRGDSVEIYLNTALDSANRPQTDDYQINLGIHGKARIMQGAGASWGNWNGLIDYAMDLKGGTLNDGIETNDTGYSIEVMIPYEQIGITKQSNIGISFGLVDKVGLANITDTDMRWLGWFYEGVHINPQSPVDYMVLKADNSLITREELEMPDAVLEGYVLNKMTKQGASGVSVMVGDTLVATTDENGYYETAYMSSNSDITLTYTHADYIVGQMTYTRNELRESNGGAVTKTIELVALVDAEATDITGCVKNVLAGVVEGVSVEVKNSVITATTDANGQFTLEDAVVAGDITYVISKEGFATMEYVVEKDLLVENGITNVGDIDLPLAYNTTAATIGGNRGLNAFDFKTTRTKDGLFFKFSTDTAFDGEEALEFFLHVGDTKPLGFRLLASGNIGYDTRDQFRQLTNEQKDLLEYNIYLNDVEATGGYITFMVPYSVLDFNPGDIFGFSAGFWGYNDQSKGDWDGFGFDGFIDPVLSENYVRVDAQNKLYKADSNKQKINIKGNVVIPGVTVSFNGVQDITDEYGNYHIFCDKITADSQITYSKLGYQTETKDVLLSSFALTSEIFINAQLSERLITLTGTITDVANSEAVANAKITIGETTYTADENGVFTIENLPSKEDLVLTVVADNFVNFSKTITVQELNVSETISTEIALTSSLLTTTITGSVVNVLGNLSDVTVSIKNTSITATTDANGNYTLNDAPLSDMVLEFTKQGYLTTTLSLAKDSLTETSNAVANVDMPLDYAVLGDFAQKNDNFGKFTGFVTRGVNALQFKFVTKNPVFAEGSRIELFISTKTTTSTVAERNVSDSDYLFNLKSDGSIQIVNWGAQKNEAIHQDMKLTITKGTDGNFTLDFVLPYAFFGQKTASLSVTNTEVVGFALGQWSETGNDWDGWVYDTGSSFNNVDFVAPEFTKDYIRLSKENILYWNSTNETVDLSNKTIKFGANLTEGGKQADNFYADVTRDNAGITFNFTGFGDFENTEFVMMYLDLGTLGSAEGWAFGEDDYQFKLYGDGSVYYKKSTNPWWKTNRETDSKLAENLVITRNGNLIEFSITLSYELLNIEATEDFGLALRQAKDNNVDYQLYDNLDDCLVLGRRIDAAIQTGYLRVKADNSLYFAN